MPWSSGTGWNRQSWNRAPASGSALKWDAAFKPAGITLSAGDMTATATSTTTLTTRGTIAFNASLKQYVGLVFNAVSANNNVYIGAANASETNTNGIGGSTNSVSFRGAGQCYYNAAQVGSVEFGVSMTSSENILCCDGPNGKLWYYNPAYGWASYDPASDNPTTNTGGYTLSSGPSGTLYVAATLNVSGDAVTLRTSGFSNTTQVSALAAAGWSVVA